MSDKSAVPNSKSDSSGKAPTCGEAGPGCELALQTINASVPVDAIQELCRTFQRSARRWELIVYPSIIAMILLAGGGFFFIYSLTTELKELALQAQPQIGSNINKVADSVTELSATLNQMNRNIDVMRVRMEAMSNDVNSMSKQMVYMKNMSEMNDEMRRMNASMQALTMQTEAMRWSMQSVNQSIARPMSLPNAFLPW